jgi:hypothetical protein
MMRPLRGCVSSASLVTSRSGGRVSASTSSQATPLSENTIRDRLASFREQIVTIPGAVTGDVGSFLVVEDWKLDFAALTRQQQDHNRRYITSGVERGLI